MLHGCFNFLSSRPFFRHPGLFSVIPAFFPVIPALSRDPLHAAGLCKGRWFALDPGSSPGMTNASWMFQLSVITAFFPSSRPFFRHPGLFSRHPGLEPGSIACCRSLQRAVVCAGSRVFARDDKCFMDVSTSSGRINSSSTWHQTVREKI